MLLELRQATAQFCMLLCLSPFTRQVDLTQLGGSAGQETWVGVRVPILVIVALNHGDSDDEAIDLFTVVLSPELSKNGALAVPRPQHSLRPVPQGYDLFAVLPKRRLSGIVASVGRCFGSLFEVVGACRLELAGIIDDLYGSSIGGFHGKTASTRVGVGEHSGRDGGLEGRTD